MQSTMTTLPAQTLPAPAERSVMGPPDAFANRRGINEEETCEISPFYNDCSK